MSTFLIGRNGENEAVKYLEENGYNILKKNYHAANGEIDIIAKKERHLSFVEVKTRKNEAFGTCMDAITKTKYQNIKKGALNYLSEHDYKNYRIDIIGITLQPELKIEHIQNV